MPMIRITGENGALVYEGEGDLVMDPDPFAPGHQGRLSIRQERRRDGEVRSRQIDITSLLTETGTSYSVHRSFPPPVLSIDLGTDPPTVSVPDLSGVRTELRIDRDAPWFDWLRNVLEEPVETPEERSARHELRAERLRTQAMPLDFVRPAHQTLIAQAMGIPERTLYSEDELRDVLDMTVVRSAEHDRIIAETEAEFPHDPLGYGQVYPGDTGTSRWTPPADPNEKIRSCP